MHLPIALVTVVLVGSFAQTSIGQPAAPLGPFSNESEVGTVFHAGSARLDAARDALVVTGSGANMWSSNDDFHFVWKQVSGDVSLSADVRFLDTNGVAHRKACLLIRQSLDPDAVYADAALHASGLTSLQFRDAKGAVTSEVQSAMSAPARLGIQKRGDYVTLSVAGAGEALRPSGATCRLTMRDPYYVGLAVCAHDSNALTQAEFSRVQLSLLAPRTNPPASGGSTLEVLTIASKGRRVVYQTSDRIEAPNWSRDGKFFIFNSRGRLYKLPIAGGTPEVIDTGLAIRCNNDHGLSPDGSQLAISDQSQGGNSLVYVLPATGGTPRLVTTNGPSYWHGWSADGATLAFCGARNGNFDVYTIPAAGGEEKRLTTDPALDDGPDYSPDGACIYFNSERTGLMQIWRMKPDGSDPQQITTDGYNNWFAHPSPDGKWIVFLTYGKEVKGHPANQEVALRMMPAGGGAIQELARFFGGQGTINAPSWSPDSKEVAYISYLPNYGD